MPSLISEIHAARRLMLASKPSEALKSIAAHEAPFATLALVRGECHYVLSQWADAVREFENALRLSPKSSRAEIMLELASEMVELSRTMRTPASIEQLLAVPSEASAIPPIPKLFLTSEADDVSPDPNGPPDEIGLVSETLAEVMIRQGKFEDARKVYIQLSRLNPDRYEYFRERIQKLENSD